MQIKIDWRPVWWSFAWGWVLFFVPIVVMAMAASSSRYTVSDGAFNARTGIMTKRHTAVDLYRVKTVSATDNALVGGKLHIVLQDGTTYAFKYISDPGALVTAIRGHAESERRGKNFTYRESF